LMIGRGALGKPWIFSRIKAAFAGENLPENPPTEEVFATIFRYAETLARTRGVVGTENIRWLLARLHPFTYGVAGGKNVRANLSHCTTLTELRELLARACEK